MKRNRDNSSRMDCESQEKSKGAQTCAQPIVENARCAEGMRTRGLARVFEQRKAYRALKQIGHLQFGGSGGGRGSGG